MPQGPEPAQHRADEGADQGAIALGKGGESRRQRPAAVKQIVERAAAAQHAVEDVGGDAAHRKAGDRFTSAHRLHCEILFARLRIRDGYAKSEPMPTDQAMQQPASEADESEPRRQRPRSAEAQRALAEAAARRAQQAPNTGARPKEINGRGSPDPTRYGDWEVNGLASDF
jgi:hypothetical protein